MKHRRTQTNGLTVDRDWIKREFDSLRQVIESHHLILQTHIQQDDTIQGRILQELAEGRGIVRTLVYIGSASGLLGATIAGIAWFTR